MGLWAAQGWVARLCPGAERERGGALGWARPLASNLRLQPPLLASTTAQSQSNATKTQVTQENKLVT